MPFVNINNIEVEVTFKPIKNLNLRILPPDGQVKVSAPHYYSLDKVTDFLIKKHDWIQKTQFDIQKRKYPAAPKFENGASHNYLGKSYTMVIKPSKLYNWVELSETSLLVHVKGAVSPVKVQKLVSIWYRNQLDNLLRTFIERWERPMQVRVREYGIKQMKTRWGTCNPRAERIWLNLELIKKPLECIEYVVVHEMVHLLEPSHNHRFKAFMSQFLPNWKELKNKLNQ